MSCTTACRLGAMAITAGLQRLDPQRPRCPVPDRWRTRTRLPQCNIARSKRLLTGQRDGQTHARIVVLLSAVQLQGLRNYTTARVTVKLPGALPLRITASSTLPGPPSWVRPSAAHGQPPSPAVSTILVSVAAATGYRFSHGHPGPRTHPGSGRRNGRDAGQPQPVHCARGAGRSSGPSCQYGHPCRRAVGM
jgi:hypothetical protein